MCKCVAVKGQREEAKKVSSQVSGSVAVRVDVGEGKPTKNKLCKLNE